MGYCNASCEYITARHNCGKYNKRLSYSKASVGGNSFGACHERCSECDKDYAIAALKKRMNPRKVEKGAWNSCPVCNRNLMETDSEDYVEYDFCPFCGQKLEW